MKKNLYLVTGAAGFLGGNLVGNLLQRGERVRALVLRGDPAAAALPPEVELCYGDVSDKASLEAFFTLPAGESACVIHTASIVSLSPEPSRKIYDVNVMGTRHITDMCVEKKVKKLVYVGSTGAIKEAPAGEVMREPARFPPVEVVGYYAATKAMAGNYVLDAVKARGLNASIVCPTGICGPRDYAYGPVASVIIQYCHGNMPIGVEGYFNSVDVRDLAAGVLSCVEKGAPGESYIMSNELVSMKRLFDLISAYSGAPRVETILRPEEMRAMALRHAGGGLD